MSVAHYFGWIAEAPRCSPPELIDALGCEQDSYVRKHSFRDGGFNRSLFLEHGS